MRFSDGHDAQEILEWAGGKRLYSLTGYSVGVCHRSGRGAGPEVFGSRESLSRDELNSWRQGLSMDLFGSGAEQTAADSFELCSVGTRKTLIRGTNAPAARANAPSGRSGWTAGDPASG